MTAVDAGGAGPGMLPAPDQPSSSRPESSPARTAAGSPAAEVAGDATVAGPSGRGLWRRYRVPLALALAIVLVALLIGIARVRSVSGELDPRATDDGGSRALATLLSDRGVDVVRTTELAEATEPVTDRTVVLVPFPNLLPSDALRPLGAANSGRVVLVAPDVGSLDEVSDEIQPAGTDGVETRTPGCAEEAAIAAGEIRLGGRVYRSETGTVCYGDDEGLLAIARARGGADLIVLGSGDPLTNARLAENGNAALALNLLGADGSADQVRWLVPAPGAAADAGGDGESLSDILPGWVRLAALQLLLAALLAALWRARRLGPPVTEPLPVVVRAAEAVEGRARLYRRAQARDRAADALRSGALARLVPRLGLGRDSGGEPSPEAVVAAVSARCGEPSADVEAALYGPVPVDDAELVRLANALDSIVRSTLDPEVGRP